VNYGKRKKEKEEETKQMKTSLQTNATNEVHGSPSSSLPDDKKVWASLETSPIDESDYAYWERVRMRITGYWASFVLNGIMIPIVSSVILVSLYFSFNDLVMRPPLIGYLDSHSPWNILLLAHLLTIVLWLFTALVCYPFARAQSARPGSYGLLNPRIAQRGCGRAYRYLMDERPRKAVDISLEGE
jgi:hypothetical protein